MHPSDLHIVYAVDHDHVRHRVTEPLPWNDAIDTFTLYDNARRAKGNSRPVKFYAVRSADDPEWPSDGPLMYATLCDTANGGNTVSTIRRENYVRIPRSVTYSLDLDLAPLREAIDDALRTIDEHIAEGYDADDMVGNVISEAASKISYETGILATSDVEEFLRYEVLDQSDLERLFEDAVEEYLRLNPPLTPEQEAAKNNTMTIAMNWAFNNYHGTVGYRYYRSLRAMSKDGRRAFHRAAIFNRKAA